MQEEKSAFTLTKELYSVSSWELIPVLVITVAVAIGSVVRLAFSFGYNYGTFRSVNGTHLTCCVNFVESYLIPITIGLLVALIGLWAKNTVGFFFALIALAWTLLVYILWYRGTLSVLQYAEVRDFSHLPDQGQYFLPLNEATWWDLMVLAVVITLVIWQIRILIGAYRSSVATPQT